MNREFNISRERLNEEDAKKLLEKFSEITDLSIEEIKEKFANLRDMNDCMDMINSFVC